MPAHTRPLNRLATGLAAVTLAAVTLALGTAAVAGGAQGAAAAPGDSPLRLYAPDRVVAYTYDGEVYTDLGIRLVAPVGEPFEIWADRPSYDDPIRAEWRPASGPAVALPAKAMRSFTGLSNFLTISVTRVSTGDPVATWQQDACLNGDSQRVVPDAPARSPYPWGCPWNPYTLGSVMGVEGGHAVTTASSYERPLALSPGKYDVRATINRRFTETFGIGAAAASERTRLVVKRDTYARSRPAGSSARPTPAAQPHAQAPSRAAAGVVGSTAPDLRSLPAWGIHLNRKGTALRFAATVWNGGDSPLVVDGFRREGEDVMDAYQYFYDADGNETGHQAVGEMHWHAHNHNHWHFEDFARYRLLDADLAKAVLSTKRSFCLANTDAVDYTVPNAEWHPENTDLATACGGYDALSVREVLASGSGDTYLQYRYGQAFKVADLPNGTYWIAVEANPPTHGERHLVELDTTNNDSVRRITLKGGPDDRRVVVAPVGIIEEEMPGWMRH